MTKNEDSGNRNGWQMKLYQAMNDKKLIVYKDERIVIIRDKFPKVPFSKHQLDQTLNKN